MIAMLGMYDMPAIRPANDRLWTAVRARLGHGPDHLTRDIAPHDVWLSPDLLLAQTCGYPYRAYLHGRVSYVTTPDYDLPGCPPGFYASCLVVRRDDPAHSETDLNGYRFAYNDAMSQSGWAAPMTHLASLGVAPGALVATGAHRASAQAVTEGRADLAGIDAQTWRLLCARDTVTADLRVLAHTTPTPGLPLITGCEVDPAPLRAALEGAISDLSRDDRDVLGLRGFVEISPETYLGVPTPPPPAT